VNECNIVVVGCHWHRSHNELSFITRSLAGAASRWANLTVLTDGPDLTLSADGAFDVLQIGEAGSYRWPGSVPSDCIVIVDDLTEEIADLLLRVDPRSVFYVVSSHEPSDPSWQRISLVRNASPTENFVKMYAPVNPHAALHRHNGFGFTGYHLVLSGRFGNHDDPPPEVAWLTAGLHESDVLFVEDGVAFAWKGRVLRGSASVDSRMDLWRLVAHACTCIDLAPGRQFARECVEAMRFGTPVIVPADSGVATLHAAAGHGKTFADPSELLETAISFADEPGRRAASDDARAYAEANHGSPAEFAASLRDVLTGAVG
jgi:hypothetical protein